jgi:hypothetical protein
MRIEPCARRGTRAVALCVIFESRWLVGRVLEMFSPPFGLGPVIYQLQDSYYQGKGEEQTFMIPVNMKFVVILMLHSTLSTVSCDVVGGSSGASSHFSLGIKKKVSRVYSNHGGRRAAQRR